MTPARWWKKACRARRTTRCFGPAIAEERILITLDLHFSDIRAYPPGSCPGIWVLRAPKQTFKAIEALVQAAVRLCAVEWVRGQLWVIDEKRVRIRDRGA